MVTSFARGLLCGGSALLTFGSVLAAGDDALKRVAEPGSPVEKVGQVILYFVGDRTLEDAGGASFNPFSIDGEVLLYTAGSFFISSEPGTGQDLHEGEFSILPQYQTPRGAFAPSAEQSPVIPFAFMKGGVCQAGYVGGYPVPAVVYHVDLAGASCHATSVEDLLHSAYEAAASQAASPEPGLDESPVEPSSMAFNAAAPTDGDLELAVWAAYNGAYDKAMQHPRYLFFNGTDYDAVRRAIVARLEREGMREVAVSRVPAVDLASTRACGEAGQTTLRVAFTSDGAGIAIAASSPRRVYAYEYDPALSSDLIITEARDCATSGLGRAPSAGSG
ncbi:MAG: hypothetical protein Q8L54_00700 [Devosia sp.]|nr:hypothetical protein [Devosia sp.]